MQTLHNYKEVFFHQQASAYTHQTILTPLQHTQRITNADDITITATYSNTHTEKTHYANIPTHHTHTHMLHTIPHHTVHICNTLVHDTCAHIPTQLTVLDLWT